MNKHLLNVIERAVRSDKQDFPLNQSWQYLHLNYNVGQTQGKNLKVTQQDKDDLVEVVKHETGVDLLKVSVAGFSAMHREEALMFALDEKIAGVAVKKDRLAIKALAGRALKINGHTYSLPGCGYLDLALADICSVAHQSILVIENYRCFDQLEKIKLNFPERYDDPLVLFRGDNSYSENAVRRILEQFHLQVLVMADLDPQGLIIAQSFPNVIGLIAPKLDDLEILFKDKQKANPKLYGKQLAGCQQALSTSSHMLIRHLWEMMKRHQAGLVQEYWLQEGYKLEVHSLNSCAK